METLKLPTLGRIVWYSHNGDDPHCEKNGAHSLPAIVIQVFGPRLNLAVHSMNPDGPVVLRYSVPHKSEGQTDAGIEGPYWEWPEIS